MYKRTGILQLCTDSEHLSLVFFLLFCHDFYYCCIITTWSIVMFIRLYYGFHSSESVILNSSNTNDYYYYYVHKIEIILHDHNNLLIQFNCFCTCRIFSRVFIINIWMKMRFNRDYWSLVEQIIIVFIFWSKQQ